MLIGGTDVSGGNGYGEQSFVSLVVGTEDAINNMYHNTGVKKIHMVRLEEEEKTKVMNALNFDNCEVNAWCFYVERQKIINDIFQRQRLKNKRGSKEKIYKEFDKIFLKCFWPKLNNFCLQHGEEIGKLTIECDSDMKQAVRRWGFTDKGEGKAHEIADAVAWFNSHNKKINGCREISFADEIKTKLTSSIIK